jgi:hypothetical protein
MKQMGWSVIDLSFLYKDKIRQYGYQWNMPILGGSYLSLHRICEHFDVKKLLAYIKQKRIFLVKIDSKSIFGKKTKQFLLQGGFTKTSWCNAPTKTKILNLTSHSLDRLFMECKPKTRYNIRLAERRGYDIRFLTTAELLRDKKVLKDFQTLLTIRKNTKNLDLFTVDQLVRLQIIRVGANSFLPSSELEFCVYDMTESVSRNMVAARSLCSFVATPKIALSPKLLKSLTS